MENRRRLITEADLYLLRTRLDFLMLHTMMLRGEFTRKAELADLCSVLPDESSECLSLVLRTSAGKTILLAMGGNLRIQHYHAALRYRDPVLCPVGVLAY
jgi:Centromere DNA-binding protein complex CBF3 subunit, domain 2